MDFSYPLLCSCERHATRTALVIHGERTSYAQLERHVAGLATGLTALGFAGARVATVLYNEPETVELYMALARVGAVNVPMNTRLTVEEKRYILNDSGANVFIVDNEHLDEAEQLVGVVTAVAQLLSARPSKYADLVTLRESAPSEPPLATHGDDSTPASIMYTSGTTGFAKGVVRTHRANIWNAINSTLGSPSTVDDTVLFNLPIFGIGFLHFALPALLSGSVLLLDRSFHANRVWRLLDEHRVTRTFLAPTMLAAMLDEPDQASFDVSALRVIHTAYAMPERLRERAIERFGDIFVHMYGLTEAQLTSARPGEFAAKPTSVGRTMGVNRVRLVDVNGHEVARGSVGEILFEGPSVMSGYLNQPEQSAATLVEGWVHTGDLGTIDEEGDLRYVGRSKEMIKTGGFSVDPVEVENAILRLTRVFEASAIGVEDEKWGEMVVAFVSPQHGATVSSEDVVAVCRESIASYKIPKRVIVVDELPKNATGKIERGVLRRWYREGATQSPLKGTL